MSKKKKKDEVTVNSFDKNSPQVPVERYDLQILQSIRRIMRAVDIYSRKLRAKSELTTPQLICLNTIVEHKSLTVSQIADKVYLSPSTVVGILDRLESRRLVTRERSKSDRRVVNINSTEAGIEICQNAPSALQDNLHKALLELPVLEQATIALSIKRVVDLMEVSEIDAAPILESSPIQSKQDI